MASKVAVLAVIRAFRPHFRSKQDKAAFAVHAIIYSNDYKLMAVGDAADTAGTKDAGAAQEVAIDGWNAESDRYTFLYFLDDGKKTAQLLVKLLVVDNLLLVNMLHTEGAQPAGTPSVLELEVERYATDSADVSASYRDLDELIERVQSCLTSQMGAAASAAPVRARLAAAVEGPREGMPAGRRGQGPPELGTQPAVPLTVGEEDRMPGFVGPPAFLPGGVLAGPGGVGPTGGGMHVGPEHPFFVERLRHPELRPELHGMRPAIPGYPPQARWDPIRPEGLEGWNPEDFQRGRPPGGPPGPGIDPDIMQPGAGRGADWDAMFG